MIKILSLIVKFLVTVVLIYILEYKFSVGKFIDQVIPCFYSPEGMACWRVYDLILIGVLGLTLLVTILHIFSVIIWGPKKA